ncbi:MAG: 30S ribosomal protein S3 [Methanobacteriota archaeon]|nr:MAG: 30S ribosomal protein S3 [Euryarchaeota archaeon]
MMVMESIRKKFIQDAVIKSRIAEFLEKELENVWVAGVSIQKSPVETRIFIEMLDPKRLINRRSRMMQRLIMLLRNDFHIDNPKISIIEVKEPWLEPRIIAKRAARNIERGRRVKGVLYRLMRDVMGAGALGVEIVAVGKLGAKGSKARKVKVVSGFVPKAGDPARYVGLCNYSAVTKAGIIGINVRIAKKELLSMIKPDLVEENKVEESIVEETVAPQEVRKDEKEARAA